MSEAWTGAHIFCPACGGALRGFQNNRPAADFYCLRCAEQFELKSSGKKWGRKIADGAYATMIERIGSAQNPHFFFLHYNPAANFRVENLFCIPKRFFTAELIEKRKPLSKTARRAGWVGCNILAEKLPESGKIFYIRNGANSAKHDIAKIFAKTQFLQAQPLQAKGWLIDMMRQIDILGKQDFTLAEFYAAAEGNLQRQHPENSHIRAKIRQQLQFLRDKNYLRFSARGVYELV